MIFLSMTAAGALSVAISIFVARWLGASDFGVYSILVSVQGVVTLLAAFSLHTSIAKFVSEYRSRSEEEALSFAKSGLVLVVVLAVAVCVVYAALSEVIGDMLYGEPIMVSLVPYSALVVFSGAFLATSIGVVQGCQRFKLMAVMQISYPLLTFLSVVGLLPLMGIEGIFVGYFVSQLAVSIGALMTLNRTGFKFLSGRLDLRRKSDVVTKLYSFALPAVLGSVMVTPVIWVANTELTLSSGFDAMGYFAVAFVFFNALIVMPNAIAVPMMPRVSELTVGRNEDIEKLVAKVMRTMSIGLFPLLFAGALFSDFVVDTLYGVRYSASVEAVYLMIATVYFFSLSSVIGTMIIGMGKMWLGLGLNALWAAMFLTMVFVAVPELGTNGLALSYVLSYGLFLIPVLLVPVRLLHVGVTGVYLPVISAIVLFSIGLFAQDELHPYGLMVNIALFVAGAVYFYMIGRDVFDATYLRLRSAFPRSRS